VLTSQEEGGACEKVRKSVTHGSAFPKKTLDKNKTHFYIDL